MKCKESKGGVTTCTVGKRTFTLHPGKDNKRAKAARGRALHRKFACERSKRTGRFTSCRPKRGGK